MLKHNKIIKALQQNNFHFLKIELEANTHPETSYCDYCDEGYQDCSECDASGKITCGICEGNRQIEQIDNGEISQQLCNNCEGNGKINCIECNGEGNYTCSECDGDYETNEDNFDNTENTFFNIISIKAKKAILYSQFYNDSSVDTELTLTINVKNIKCLSEYIEKFARLGNDFNTENAGLHITLMTQKKYPSDEQLPTKRINNFIKTQAEFLPLLFISGSRGDGTTRELDYRTPQISPNTKYSAIYTHNNTCLEYRVFDPCFSQPERIYNYLNIIVKTLKYYSEKYRGTKKLAEQITNNRELSGMFNNFNQITQTYEKYKPDVIKYIKTKVENKTLTLNKAYATLSNLKI